MHKRMTAFLFAAALGIVGILGRPLQAQNVANLGISAALQSAAFDSVPLPLIAEPAFASFDSPTRVAVRQAARERYLFRRANRRLEASRLRQARLERSFRDHHNPGFRLPPTIGHFKTRFGFVTGPAFGR